MSELIINNYTRGELDHDMNGRFDLPIYTNGFEVCNNFISNYKGNIKYRTGFKFVSQTVDNSEAVLMEFKFNTEQAYLLEFTNNKLRFYTYDANGNFGYVLDSNNDIYELSTGITLAQAKKLQKAQNADVMYLAMNEINPKKLKRVSANSFTIEDVSATGLSFTTAGYPTSVTFYSGRLWYGGFSAEPLSIYASKTADYDYFTIPGTPLADDALKLTLAEITDPIEWLEGGKSNLYAGNHEGISLINGGTVDQPITSTAVAAHLANYEGASDCVPIKKDSQMFYVSSDKRRIFMFDYDLMTEKFIATDLNWISQEITKGLIKKIFYKKDENNNIYALTESGQILVLLYNSNENICGWFNSSTAGDIYDICTVTRPDGKDDLFVCKKQNGVFCLEVLASEVEFKKFFQTPHYLDDKNKTYYNRLIAEDLKKCVYLDRSQTLSSEINKSISISSNVITATENIFSSAMVGHYLVYKTKTGKEYGYFKITNYVAANQIEVEVLSDGYYPETTYDSFYISFNKISNLSLYEGQTLSVVADGGYIGEFTVSSGVLDLKREVTVCTFGLLYKGILKTFNLGFYYNGRNYQTANKRISEFILRFVNSAGGNIGTDIYDMYEIQDFSPAGFYDLPPLPMDGDKQIDVGDVSDRAKSIYITQDKPLPLNITMMQYNVEFGGDE